MGVGARRYRIYLRVFNLISYASGNNASSVFRPHYAVTSTGHLVFVFRENSVGKSHGDVIVFKSYDSKSFRLPQENEKPSFSNSPSLKCVSIKSVFVTD